MNTESLKNIEFIQISSYLRAYKAHSTRVENIRQIRLFMQNKPNFPHFSLKNDDFTEKQTQFKANSKPILAQKSGGQSQTKPIQTQFYPGVYPRMLLPRLAAGECELTLLWCLPSGVLTCSSAGGRGSNPISPVRKEV